MTSGSVYSSEYEDVMEIMRSKVTHVQKSTTHGSTNKYFCDLTVTHDEYAHVVAWTQGKGRDKNWKILESTVNGDSPYIAELKLVYSVKSETKLSKILDELQKPKTKPQPVNTITQSKEIAEKHGLINPCSEIFIKNEQGFIPSDITDLNPRWYTTTSVTTNRTTIETNNMIEIKHEESYVIDGCRFQVPNENIDMAESVLISLANTLEETRDDFKEKKKCFKKGHMPELIENKFSREIESIREAMYLIEDITVEPEEEVD